MKIFFMDLDGTLEDSRQDMAEAVNRVRAQFDLKPLANPDIAPNVTRGMMELYKSCFADLLASRTSESQPMTYWLEKIRLAYEKDYYDNVCKTTKLYEHMRETLATLSTLGKIVIVTNKPEKISRKLLKELRVDTYITDVLGGDSCAENKPSPMPLQIGAERLGFVSKTDTAFMIGDSAADVKAGQAFGAKTIWCRWGYVESLESGLTPSFSVLSPKDIPTIVTSTEH